EQAAEGQGERRKSIGGQGVARLLDAAVGNVEKVVGGQAQVGGFAVENGGQIDGDQHRMGRADVVDQLRVAGLSHPGQSFGFGHELADGERVAVVERKGSGCVDGAGDIGEASGQYAYLFTTMQPRVGGGVQASEHGAGGQPVLAGHAGVIVADDDDFGAAAGGHAAGGGENVEQTHGLDGLHHAGAGHQSGDGDGVRSGIDHHDFHTRIHGQVVGDQLGGDGGAGLGNGQAKDMHGG